MDKERAACCPRCHHKHIIITNNPDGNQFNDIITCGRCGNNWQYGKDAGHYALSKFAQDKRC